MEKKGACKANANAVRVLKKGVADPGCSLVGLSWASCENISHFEGQ